MAVGAATLCSGCATAITSTPFTIGPDDAGIFGKVVSDTGGPVEYWAQFGPTTAYGSETAHQTVDVAPNTLVTVRVTIGGLQRATTYHYRLCARDSQQKGGPGCGQDRSFTTQSVGCEETVTTDVKLTGDLDCPFENGLIVGAAGIDINLAGHGMFGTAERGGGDTGIDNAGGYDDVTIRNGTVGFSTGVVMVNASRNRMLDVGTTGVAIRGGEANEIRHSDASGPSFGIVATDTSGLVVADSSAAGPLGDGLTVTGDLARIVRNRFVRGSGSAVRLQGSGARIADNFVQGSWLSGGIVVSGANDVLVDNTITDLPGPVVPGAPPEFGDGIFINAFSSGVTLRRNDAERNGGDGIDVRATGTRLESNTSFNNAGWGIRAVPGVIDLGGNTAGGNGAGQCQNVFCP